MSSEKILTPFYDLKECARGKSGFFFLENILKARADLHLESGGHDFDQELNVYLAGLLNSLVSQGAFLGNKPYISPYDIDIRRWLAAHPGVRNTYMVYRENADFGLALLGLFSGYAHKGSYYHIVMFDNNEKSRIALYYEIAASALVHLKGRGSLIDVFEALSDHIDEIIRIIRYAARQYFDIMERISEGSFFHLERELDEMDKMKRYEEKIDEFLKLYAAYKELPSDEKKKQIETLAEEIKKINSDFQFDGVR